MTVGKYAEEWVARRRGQVATVKDEEGRLRLHVLPRIGEMALADVRPRTVRDFVLTLRADKALAPRTVRHVFALLHRMFKSAVVEELIAFNPVVVDRGVLPKNIDKDPAWRSTAVFTREEVEALISDARVPHVRRVLHALKGLAGLRHGEAAGLRWRDYEPQLEPLGKLTIARSYDHERTKTGITREVPVHPVLACVLAEWKLSGWAEAFGRLPKPDDLIVPNGNLRVRQASNADNCLGTDLEKLGMRHRRGHDLRRTFITLAQVDGARRDVLKVVTHGPSAGDIVALYTSFPWPAVCAEVAKLRVHLRAAEVAVAPVAATFSATVPDVAPDSPAISEPMAGIEPAAYGLRRQGREGKAADSRAVSVGVPGAGSGSSRIDAHPRDGVEGPGADFVARDLLAAAAAWLERHEGRELRRALLRILVHLDDER